MRTLIGVTAIESHNTEGEEFEFVELSVKWKYYFSAATYDEPEDVEFEIVASDVTGINGRPLMRGEEIEVPDWVDWDEVQRRIFYIEGL